MQLFGTRPDRVDLLNTAASLFFRVIQDALWEDTLLHLARLTDPPRSRGKENLTLTVLPDLIADGALQSEIKSLLEAALAKAAFARDWRNRRIAHRDLSLALREGAEPLAATSRQHVKEALAAIVAVLNRVHLQYLDSEVVYDLGKEPGGAESLLYVVRDGLALEEERRARLREGKLGPKDLEPPRTV